MKNTLGALSLLLFITACGSPEQPANAEGADAALPASDSGAPAIEPTPTASLDDILAAQSDEMKARYGWRHPKETLEFFGVQPGQVVVEALPGDGWYTRILLPYLGSAGKLLGVNYADTMWSKFGFMNEEQLAKLKTWTIDFSAGAQEWRGDSGAPVDAFVFGALPEAMKGTADTVLLIRALHNLARFENDGAFLTAALADVNAVLKPGGIVGIVQHEARADTPDEWANGNAGYLKRSFVIEQMQKAGFELVDQAEFNQNPNDTPTTEEFVWRLPPNYRTSGDDGEKKAAMDAIGESNRMTLKFRKL
jgi:predicted methyltransferase